MSHDIGWIAGVLPLTIMVLAIIARVADGEDANFNCTAVNTGLVEIEECQYYLKENTQPDVIVVITSGICSELRIMECKGAEEICDLFSLIGNNLTLNEAFDYEDPEFLLHVGPAYLEIICDENQNSLGSVYFKFLNVDDQDLTVVGYEEDGYQVKVTELVKYPIYYMVKVEPPIEATDGDQQTFILYELEEGKHPFQLVESVTEKTDVCTDSQEANYPVLLIATETIFNYEVIPVYNLTVSITSVLQTGGVQSCDGGERLTEQLKLIVNIEDLDDQPPRFTEESYRRVIEENSLTSMAGTPAIYAYDLDTLGADIEYSLLSSGETWDCRSNVRINDTTGILHIIAEFDFETHAVCKLVIKAVQEDNGYQYALAPLTITITDVNDNCPDFVGGDVIGSYSEGDPYVYDTATNNWVEIKLTDNDSNLTYEVVHTSTYFDVTMCGSCGENTIRIEPNESLPISSDDFTIIAIDTLFNGTSCNEAISVQVVVASAEEFDPVFDQNNYTAEINEEEAKDDILQVNAASWDGSTAGITYDLPNIDDVYFTINETTGSISVVVGLDYEEKQTYSLSVRATDTRTVTEKTAITNVIIAILNINDHNPELDGFPMTLEISEATPVNTIVGVVQATDGDADAELTYNITGASPGFPLMIDPGTGEFSTDGALDADTPGLRQFNASVTVSDGMNVDDGVLQLFILDVNDHYPQITINSTNMNITENITGPLQLNISTEDGDYQALNRHCNITTEPDAGSNITVDFSSTESKGIIEVHGPFDRESQSEFRFTVTAVNAAPPYLQSSRLVVIDILDDNDQAPQFTEETQRYCTTLEVQEEIISDPLCTFVATDNDEPGNDNSRIEYSVSNTDYFEISSDGVLSLTKTLDRETHETVMIVVTATDGGSPVSLNISMDIVVTVLDANDNPPQFVEPFDRIVDPLMTPVGSQVIEVSATDVDAYPNNIVSFTPVNISSSSAWDMFALQSTQDGTFITLSTEPALNDTVTVYELYVMASNPGKEQTATQFYKITVIDSSFCYVTFNETLYTLKNNKQDLVQGEALLTIDASSSCGREDFVLEIEHQTLTFFNGSSFSVATFSLADGSLSPADPNVEPGIYQITVIARNSTDPGEKISIEDARVELTVVTETNQAPLIQNGEETTLVQQPKLLGEDVFSIQAEDPDDVYSGNHILSYNKIFEVDGDGVERNYFRVDPVDGRVYTDDNLLDISNTVVNLTFKVIDSGLPPLTDESYILLKLLLPANENTPPVLFSDCEAIEVIPEGEEMVGKILCSMISDQEVAYTLTSGNDKFAIDGAGVVTLIDPLDYETEQEHSVTIGATNIETKLSTTLQILFKVEDINEFAPVFQSDATFVLSEDIGDECPLSKFGVVTATDKDGSKKNSKIEYTLSGDERFEINNSTGVISKIECIDIENVPADQYITLTVTATNSEGVPPMSATQELIITVADLNDVPPYLSVIGEGEFQTNETIPGQLLFQLTYSDEDVTPVNRESTFTHICSSGGNCENFVFDVEDNTLSISASGVPPSTSGAIKIIVTVTNVANPPLSDTETVTYLYDTDGDVYFPEDRQNQSVTVKENDSGNITMGILGPVGTSENTQFSVLEEYGTVCSILFVASYESETYVTVTSLQPIDYDTLGVSLIEIWVAISTPDDTCEESRRKRRQTQVPLYYSVVTIIVDNVPDEPPQFTDFTLNTGSRRYYVPIHVSRTRREKIYDMFIKVTDEDGTTEDHSYHGGSNDIVEVTVGGDVIINKHLSSDDVTGNTASLPVTVVDSAGQSTADLMLRVMSDEDIYVVLFDWDEDEQGEKKLSGLVGCVPVHIYLFNERVVRSGSLSELWLYGIDGSAGGPEDFITRKELQEYLESEDCKDELAQEEYQMKWTPTQIAVFILAAFILIGAVVMILFLLCSDQGDDKPGSSRDSESVVDGRPILEEPQESTPSEPSLASSPESSHEPKPIVKMSTFEKIAQEKNTSLYGSSEAIIDLMSEVDVTSLSEWDPPNGEGPGVGEDETDEGPIRGDMDDLSDNEEPLKPYAEYRHPPSGMSNDSSLEYILDEYDNQGSDGKEEEVGVGSATDGAGSSRDASKLQETGDGQEEGVGSATDEAGSSRDASKLQETGNVEGGSEENKGDAIRMNGTRDSQASSVGAPEESKV